MKPRKVNPNTTNQCFPVPPFSYGTVNQCFPVPPFSYGTERCRAGTGKHCPEHTVKVFNEKSFWEKMFYLKRKNVFKIPATHSDL